MSKTSNILDFSEVETSKKKKDVYSSYSEIIIFEREDGHKAVKKVFSKEAPRHMLSIIERE